MCVLRDLPQQKNPRGCMLRELPNLLCSHGNISFPQNVKEVRKSKESCLLQGRFLYLCILLRFGNTLALGSHPLVPLPKEKALVGRTSCATKPTCGDKHGSSLCTPSCFSLSSPAILFHYWDSIVHLQQYVMIVVDPFQAYMGPILPRNTVAPVTIAFPLGGEEIYQGLFQSVTGFPNH
jgi:hypothetical protein